MKRALQFSLALLAAVVVAVVGYRWIGVPLMEDVAARPPQTLERGPSGRREVALTFDAMEGFQGLPELLETLKREHVTATFFLGGRWASENPAWAAAIAEGGHIIGNHGWSLKDLTGMKDWQIEQEIVLADDRLATLFGDQYQPVFRAPLHAVDNRVLGIAARLGFRVVRWTIDPLDSQQPTKTAAFLADNIVQRSDDELKGAIIHLHVGVPETSAAVPAIIHSLRERGFTFVPVTAWVAQHAAAGRSRATAANARRSATQARGSLTRAGFAVSRPFTLQFPFNHPCGPLWRTGARSQKLSATSPQSDHET